LETESVALKHEQMELLTDWLDLMVNRKNPDPVQVSQARAELENADVDLVRARSYIVQQHDYQDLPPMPGLGWGVAEILVAMQTPRVGGVRIDPPSHTDNLLQRLEPLSADIKSHFAGLSLRRTSLSYGQRSIVEIPLWLILPVLLILPAMKVAANFRLRRRGKLNLCLACGYDLRASADRCPECGATRQLKPVATV